MTYYTTAHEKQSLNLRQELWLICPFAVSPPRQFTPWLVRPVCGIIAIQ